MFLAGTCFQINIRSCNNEEFKNDFIAVPKLLHKKTEFEYNYEHNNNSSDDKNNDVHKSDNK